MKHINIPVFVPHIGCPHDCVFCNQRVITGHQSFDIDSVDRDITEWLSSANKGIDEVEIAFFGGSFTGIGEPLMSALLEKASKYVESGDVSSIRLSTRPDYISREILDTLKKYPVKTIELGIQSVSDRVLSKSLRGHSKKDSENACALINEYGFDLVGQMMVGLPLSDIETEKETARFIVSSGAVASRIYPTVVFSRTALDHMMKTGEYIPLTPEDAAKRSAEVYKIFADNNVKVLRIGLCESEGLRSDEVSGGAYHPALGEMCLSEYYYSLIKEKSDLIRSSDAKDMIIAVPMRSISRAIGMNSINRKRLINGFPDKRFSFKEDDSLKENEIMIYPAGK